LHRFVRSGIAVIVNISLKPTALVVLGVSSTSELLFRPSRGALAFGALELFYPGLTL